MSEWGKVPLGPCGVYRVQVCERKGDKLTSSERGKKARENRYAGSRVYSHVTDHHCVGVSQASKWDYLPITGMRRGEQSRLSYLGQRMKTMLRAWFESGDRAPHGPHSLSFNGAGNPM